MKDLLSDGEWSLILRALEKERPHIGNSVVDNLQEKIRKITNRC